MRLTADIRDSVLRDLIRHRFQERVLLPSVPRSELNRLLDLPVGEAA